MIEKFSNILIDKSASVKDALKQLDKIDEKILFVVEHDKKLIGSLTDGDIRRWILKDGTLTESVENVCFKGTYYVHTDYDLESVKEQVKKRDIFYIPIVNDDKEIIEFLVWSTLFEGKITKKIPSELEANVVIMAGGKGTRLDPFTRILPKPLIPIGDKSMLEVIIEKFTAYHVDKFTLSVNHKAKIIKSYFEEIEPPYEIEYIYEDKPLGTVGALKQLEGKWDKEIILTNCDIIIDAEYDDILKHHKKNGNDITIVASLKHYKIPYGVCEIVNGGTLVQIKEKPEYDLLVNTGMYVINPKVLNYIPENEMFHITHLIDKIKPTHKIGIYPISENSWIDTGEWVVYKEAIEKLL